MPLFISDAELQAAGADVALVAERADGHIRDLLQQLEAQKARADAASITAEQRGAVVEQKFLAMSSQFKHMESEKTQLENTLERRSVELAQAQAQVHKLELESMKQDSDRERFLCELNEVRKARRELLEVVEQKNAELFEKNTYIKTYLDKIVSLTDERSNLEGKVRVAEAEMARFQAVQVRLSQEKELLEQHNSWLNEELADKVDTLVKERQSSSDMQMELLSKLARAEQVCKEMGESLQRNKEQVKDLELRLTQTREELRFTKQDAASKEDHLSLEVETASKLADLYKQSSEEWSKKAIDLEGVIKALEVHLNQVEAECKERLEKEVEACKTSEKNAMDAKEEMEKLEKELELYKKGKEKEPLFLISDFSDAAPKELDLSDRKLSLELHEDGPLLPIVPSGISGTALAAALLRDGWSITKIYIKYQEAADAWRHERQERRQSQALLQRVLQEIEQRADLILDERAEHARMMEAYIIMEEKLHLSVEEQSSLENRIRELKAELRKRERDLNGTKQECSDLQSQVVVLLKECADIKQRYGGENFQLKGAFERLEPTPAVTASDNVISERLLTFKDIHEIVEQNSQLRAIVRSLGHQNEEREMELKEAFDSELKKRTDEAAQKVSTILRKSEEQTQLIASLQGTVGMYRRLYEEEVKARSMLPKDNGIMTVAETSGDDVRSLIVRSQEDIEKVRKEASERLSVLEADLNKARQDASVARMERDRLIVEATYAREQLQTIVKDSENQRKEMDAVLARNVEFSQIITDYQKRLRENAEHVQSVEEKSRRLSVEVSVLEREKELISIAERRASQELSSLSDRVHKLQARLDNIHTVEEAQEIMRAGEKKKLEEEVNRMQKEWVGMKHELDSERAHIRHLSKEGDQVVKQAMDRIESISKELADALQKVSMSETRANVAEARCTELEANLKKTEEKILLIPSRRKLGKNSKDIDLELDTEVLSLLDQAKEDIDRLKEELDASKNHTDQYKQLAQLNEEALLRMEDAHNHFKEEAEKTKESLGSELSSLREKATNLEKLLSEKENVLAEAEAHKERALSTAEKEIVLLRESDSGKRLLLEQAEERIKALKCELEKEHQLWRTAQNNYERQVLLQADTIRELTMVSESKGHLEKELMELRAKAELSMSELGSSRVVWEMEKASLLSENESLISKLRELEEQNRILLDRVEATHILVGEHDKKSGNLLESSEHVGNDLQDVIRYLRRSKETSDMEISLLKQERLRLQKQRESALHAAEEAQANLRREHENTRVTLCSEEEFKSLQAQVREMTLLRESNAQLRLENKRNFEECQSLREKMQNKQAEVESLRKLLREREVELDATVKDVDLQKAEISRWENRVSQLLQKYKSVDLEEYNRAQSELTSSQETLSLQQAELDATKGELQKLKEVIRNLEGEILIKDETISGLEKRVKEAEGSAKAETDKFRKHMLFSKRKIENLTKEKDDMRDTLSKQLDELKASANKRAVGESHRSEAQIRQEMATQYEQAQKENENLLKEKETRIQMLERTLEREREDLKKEREELRKEKQRRMKDQRTYYDFAQKQDMEKQKLMEELSALKREKDNFSENVQAKKFGRKIVRPRIESPVESHIQPEASESGNELAMEVPEAEAEIRDDTKLASTAVTEVLESVGTTSAIVVASTSSAPSTDDVVTGLRKRPSAQAHGSMEEVPLGQGNKNEATPAHKKQKGLDLKAIVVESDTVPTVIPESLVTVEAGKVLEMDVEHATAGDPATSDRNDLNTLATAEVQQMVDVIENNQGIRPSVQTETSAPKRPRIVRSDAFHPLSAAIQRVDVMDEKTVTTEAELFPESASIGERDEQSFVPVDEHLHYDSQGPHSSPHRTEIIVGSTESGLRNPMQLTVVDAPDIAAWQLPSQENFLGSEMERTENLLIDLNDAPDVLVAPAGIPTSSEPEVAITISAVERISEMGTPVEFPLPKAVETNIITDAALTDSGVDVEDGEIEPDDSEDSIVESVPHQMFMDAPDEDKNSVGLSLDPVGKDEQQPDEIPRDEKLLLNTEPLQTKDLGASEGSAVDQKVEGMYSENIRSQRLTRQLGKGTTIFLSERAKERSVSKRSGMLPPSPGKRNPRGTKRSLGLQQGRTNPPVGELEAAGDEEAKRGGTQQSGSHTAPTASNSDALREEE